MLFKFGIDLFPLPQPMALTYLKPLKSWGVSQQLPVEPFRLKDPPVGPQLRDIIGFISQSIVLGASSSAELKRWPVEYWKKLVEQWSEQKFIVLGGPQDHFCKEIQAVDPQRVLNLSGQITWLQTAWVIRNAKATISNDTGVLHIADFLGRPAAVFIGPVPFGYPYRASTLVLEKTLKCKPCSKHGFDPCKNPEYQKCLKDITPTEVIERTQGFFKRWTSNS